MAVPILEPEVTWSQELFVLAGTVTLGAMEHAATLSTFAARLNQLCDEKKIPPKGKNRQTEVAKLFHVSQKGARKWLEGEGLPTLKHCVAIAQWGECNLEWLLSGRGPRRSDSLRVDEASSQMLAVMQTLPEYLKPTAIEQVRLLGDIERKKVSNG